MDSRQRAEKQIRLVLVMYRVEVRRRDSDEMVRFRNRARAIFDYLAAKFADDPEVDGVASGSKVGAAAGTTLTQRRPPQAGERWLRSARRWRRAWIVSEPAL